MWMLKDWILFKNVSQTFCIYENSCPKTILHKWTTLPAHALNLSHKSQFPHSLPEIFLNSAVSFVLLPSGFLSLAKYFHLHIQSTKLHMQKLITFKAPLCGCVQLPSAEKQPSVVHLSNTDRHICLVWPEKLGGLPSTNSPGHLLEAQCVLWCPLYLCCSCSCNTVRKQGAWRKTLLHANLASVFLTLIALSGWKSWQGIIDLETYCLTLDSDTFRAVLAD